MKISILYLIIFSVISNITIAQKQGQELIDSLLKELPKAKEDTNKVNLLSKISFQLWGINPDKGITFGFQGLKLANKLTWENGIANSYHSLGVNYWVKGDFDKALESYYKALKIYEEFGEKGRIASSLGNIGIIYNNLKKYNKALEILLRSLKLLEELGDKNRIARTLGNIGNIYIAKGQNDKALEFFHKGLNIFKELDDKTSIAINLGNVGDIFQRKGNFNKALDYYNQTLEIFKKIENKRGIAYAMQSLSTVYKNLGEIDDSSYIKSEKRDSDFKLSANKHYRKALEYALEAARIAEEMDLREKLYSMYETISLVYKKLGNYILALKYHEKYQVEKDSIFSMESQNKILAIEFQKEREIKNKEIKIQKLEIEHKEIIIYFAIAAVVLIALLAFFIYKRFLLKKKSNILLENKNQQITQQNIEISTQKENIERAYKNVKMLSEIGQNITTNLTVEIIIDTVYDNVSALMNSTVFGIGVYNQDKNRLEFIGAKELGESLPFFHFDLTDNNRLAVLCFNKQTEIMISSYMEEIPGYFPTIPAPIVGKNTESLLYLPLNVKEKRIGVISVQSFEKNAYTDYHLDILRNLSIYVAIALDNAEAYKQIESQNIDIEAKNSELKIKSKEINLKNEKLTELNQSKDKYLSLLKSELKLAAEYVESLIPRAIEEGPIKTKWLYIPSAEVGGDSLGYHWVDDNNFAFYLVDVSGHGVGPALHTVSIMNSIKNETLPNVDFRLPEEVLSALNETFKMKEYNNIYFTMWYGVYNKKNGTLTYSGAGHPPAYFIHGGKTSLLESTNIVLGFKSGFQYKSSTLIIDDPSTIYIYSDGVYEIRKKDGEFWNSKEMYSFLSKENASEKGSDLESLYNYVREISGKNVLDDDFSILRLTIDTV
ncbi:tetratricopeptide repeat protein [Bacteroidota bacterium]